MTKAHLAPPTPRSANSLDEDTLPMADHGPFQTTRAAEDELQDNAASDNDNGGGAEGNQGNGSRG